MNNSKILLSISVLASAVLLACTHPQQPYQFAYSGDQALTLESISRALAMNGQQVAQVDPAAQVAFTSWQDTGFRYGKIDGADATILQRYIATISPQGAQSFVVLRIDSKRCATGGWQVNGAMVTGRCEAMDGVVESQQSDLNQLGQNLQSSLATGVVVQAVPVQP